jgi:hypothetical protein
MGADVQEASAGSVATSRTRRVRMRAAEIMPQKIPDYFARPLFDKPDV